MTEHNEHGAELEAFRSDYDDHGDVLTSGDISEGFRESRRTKFGKARLELLGFLRREQAFLKLQGKVPATAEAGGVSILEFTVPQGIVIDAYKRGATCEATKYDSEGRIVGSRTFNQDDPLPVHSLVSSSNWDVDPYQHILGVSYQESGIDGDFTYAYSFDRGVVEEIEKVVIMNAPVSIRRNWLH